MNNVFNFVLLRNISYWRETGTPATLVGQGNDYPYRQSTNSCCSGVIFFSLKLANFVQRENPGILFRAALKKIKILVLLWDY